MKTMKQKLNNPPESYLMLYHLYRVKIVARTDLTMYRGVKQDRYIQQLVKKHIAEGHIGTLRYKVCEYCYITQKGVQYLIQTGKSLDPSTEIMQQYQEYQAMSQYAVNRDSIGNRLGREGGRNGAGGMEDDPGNPEHVPAQKGNPAILPTWEPLPWRQLVRGNTAPRYKQGTGGKQRELRADIRRGGTENLLFSSGAVVYCEDKPPYDRLYQVLRGSGYAKSFEWDLISERGIYYHRSELKRDGATAYSNRMQGVLFTKNGWYVLYNTLGRFSRWLESSEGENIGRLISEMQGTYAYRAALPATLVFANGRGMVASMVTGYIHGHNRNTSLPDFLRQRNQDLPWMTVKQLQALFKKAYLAELNSHGIVSVKWLVEETSDTLAKERLSLAAGNPEALRATADGAALAETATGRQVILMHCYDLIELYNRRYGNRKLTVIASERMAEQISKCLNSRLERYISIDSGLDFPFPLYDEAGNKQTIPKDAFSAD